MQTSQENSRSSLFGRVFGWFVTPHRSLTDISQQRQASLAASLSLLFFILLAVATIASIIANPERGFNSSVNLLIVNSILSLVSYIISRSKYYQISGYIIVITLSISPYFTILSGQSEIPTITLLSFIPLALVIGSALLSPSSLLIITIINIIAIAAIIASNLSVDSKLGTALGLIATEGFLLVVFGNYRNQTEKVRVQQLTNTNRELDALRENLELRIEERTSALDKRSSQLEAAAFISRQTAAIQDAKLLLEEVVNLITSRLGYYHAGIFLVDEKGQFAVMQAASSEGGKRLIARGHKLEVGREGIVGNVAFQKRARIALDVGAEAFFFNNPDLPKTRSEVALPLTVRGRLIGVLDIQSEQEQAFSNEDINALQSMADQVGLAIENARLYTESQSALKQLQSLTAESTYRNWKDRSNQKVRGFGYNPSNIYPLENKPSPSEDESEQTGKGVMAIPLLLRGTKIGEIKVLRRGNAVGWTDEENLFAQEIATQAALALDTVRLLEESQLQAAREQTIGDISTRLSQTTDLDALLKQIAQEFYKFPGVTAAGVYIGQADKETE